MTAGWTEYRKLLLGELALDGVSLKRAAAEVVDPGLERLLSLATNLDPSSEEGHARIVELAEGEEGKRTIVQLAAIASLKQLGRVAPKSAPDRLLGVVVEVLLAELAGETLGAYADGTVRYINRTGKVLVWEARDPKVSDLVSQLFTQGGKVWEFAAEGLGPLPRRAPSGSVPWVRVSLLSKGRVRAIEGYPGEAKSDPQKRMEPVFSVAAVLLRTLVAMSSRAEL